MLNTNHFTLNLVLIKIDFVKSRPSNIEFVRENCNTHDVNAWLQMESRKSDSITHLQ